MTLPAPGRKSSPHPRSWFRGTSSTPILWWRVAPSWQRDPLAGWSRVSTLRPTESQFASLETTCECANVAGVTLVPHAVGDDYAKRPVVAVDVVNGTVLWTTDRSIYDLEVATAGGVVFTDESQRANASTTERPVEFLVFPASVGDRD